MTGPVTGAAAGPGAGTAAADARRADDARLRQATRQLTGLFAQQLFKAMRETVPQGEGVVSGGSGEEMFTSMLDEHLAGAAPGRPHGAADAPGAPGPVWTRALADALFRRMRPNAAPEVGSSSAAVTPTLRGASMSRPDVPAPAAPPAGRR